MKRSGKGEMVQMDENVKKALDALSKDEFVDIFGTLVDVLFGGDDKNGADTLR